MLPHRPRSHRFCARLRHLFERSALVLDVALYRRHEIRDEVVATLQLYVDIRPSFLTAIRQYDEAVVRPYSPETDDYDNSQKNVTNFHACILSYIGFPLQLSCSKRTNEVEILLRSPRVARYLRYVSFQRKLVVQFSPLCKRWHIGSPELVGIRRGTDRRNLNRKPSEVRLSWRLRWKRDIFRLRRTRRSWRLDRAGVIRCNTACRADRNFRSGLWQRHVRCIRGKVRLWSYKNPVVGCDLVPRKPITTARKELALRNRRLIRIVV